MPPPDDLVIEVADLPYLDAKAEYLHDASPIDILDADAPRISLDEENTLASLHAKLTELYASGAAGGFPICGVIHSEDEGHSGDRAFAYIASKELEYGLGLAMAQGLPGDTPCSFRTAQAARKGLGGVRTSSSVPMSGFATPEVAAGGDSFDLSWLSDQAPLAIRARSPMELVHEVSLASGAKWLSLASLIDKPPPLRACRRCRCLSNSEFGSSSSSTTAGCTSAS